MADTPPRDLPAEAAARRDIDTQLAECGWAVQHIDDLNLTAGQRVAVREVTMKDDHGRADYLLFVDDEAVGAIEAKSTGTTLTGVEFQTMPEWYQGPEG